MHCTFLDGILLGNVIDGEMTGYGSLIYVEYCD